MAILIRTTGALELVYPATGQMFALNELHDFVGGYIEIVHIGDEMLVVNEEGLIHDLPYNRTASEMYGERIHGDVVSVSREEMGVD